MMDCIVQSLWTRWTVANYCAACSNVLALVLSLHATLALSLWLFVTTASFYSRTLCLEVEEILQKKCCWAVNPAPTRKLSTVTPAKLGALASLLYACKICLNMSEGTRGQGGRGQNGFWFNSEQWARTSTSLKERNNGGADAAEYKWACPLLQVRGWPWETGNQEWLRESLRN